MSNDIINHSTQTYVFENVEVRKTGRYASRPAIGVNKTPVVLFEVTPIHEYDGLWKKWVAPGALFEISNTTV